MLNYSQEKKRKRKERKLRQNHKGGYTTQSERKKRAIVTVP